VTEAIALRNFTAWDYAADILAQLNAFLKDHPVIQTEEEYREGAKLSKLAGKCLADVDDERKAELAPLHLQVGNINHRYKERTEPLRELVKVLDQRDTAFAIAEEKRRQEEAAEKRRLAEEARLAAMAAVSKIGEALDDSEAGVVGIDIAAVHADANKAMKASDRADREAARAERNTTFRVRTAPGERATSMRSREELTLSDPVAALTAMGITESVREAILKDARQWKRLKGEYPPGVIVNIVRSL
jgi:hypothetical protein